MTSLLEVVLANRAFSLHISLCKVITSESCDIAQGNYSATTKFSFHFLY